MREYLFCLLIRQPFAAAGAEFIIRIGVLSTVRAEAGACAALICLLLLAEADVQRIGFFAFVSDVVDGIAVFAGGVFKVIYGVDYADYYKKYTKQRKHGRRSH